MRTTARRRAGTDTIVTRMFNEHIRLPGCPQIIVTRAWAYQWLKRMGCSTDPRDGFASCDYMAFGKVATSEPLSDLHVYAAFLANVERAILQEAA